MTMSNIVFGSFDVLAGAANNTTGTASISCTGATANATYRFCTNIRKGPDVSGTQQNMASGVNRLPFNLYQDTSRTISWGNWPQAFLGGGSQNDFTSNGSGQITGTLTVYAAVPGSQQSIIPASYSESMASSVNNTLQYGSLSSAGSCPVGASTRQYSFTVTGSVITNCNVSAAALNFGSSPSTIAANIDSTTTITVQCTNTTPYSIGLGSGINASGSQRRVQVGATGNYLNYGLYTDAAYSNAWAATTSTTSCTAGVSTCYLGTGTGSNQNITVYGRVPSQTAPVVGTFTDTVVVTVTF
jgi:spore coat protein U-like protein